MDAAFRPKLLPLISALLLLLLLGFYTISDPARLAADGLLHSADMAGSTVCHRLPTHSFTINGRALPLCARCSGIYLGIMILFIFALVFRRERHASFPSRTALVGWVGLVAIMGLDGLNSLLHSINAIHLYEPQNWLRLATGMGAGLAIGYIAIILVAQTSWRHPIPQTPIANSRELAVILGVALLVVLLILSNQSVVLYVLGITSAVGVVSIIASLYLVIVQLLLGRDGRARRWLHLLPLGFCTLILTIIQIVVLSSWRLNLTGTLAGF